jgi:pimeloyl-ACP methyl ester carboxylesterase
MKKRSKAIALFLLITVLVGALSSGVYACFGSGKKALVILPGLSIKSVADSAVAVEKAYRRFEEDYTVYLFDRRANVENGYTLKCMADDTAAVMRRLGIEKADIFGASQGGMIAMYLAVYYPELVNRMVLGSTTARISDGFRHVYKNWIELAKKQNKEELAAAFADSVYSEKTLELYRDAIVRDLSDCSDHELAHFVILAEALDTLSVYDDLSKIQCKTLVLGSEGDRVVGADAQRDIAAQLGCELHMYEPVYGHAVYDEAPDYLDRMAAFFTAHDQ